jgi:ATP-dependent Clp endopeptidase proteolytic subunit ClpP
LRTAKKIYSFLSVAFGHNSFFMYSNYIQQITESGIRMLIADGIGAYQGPNGETKGVIAQDFLADLSFATSFGKTITLDINSYGGSVDQAKQMAHAIRTAGVKVHTHVIGVCASATTLILAAGSKRSMNADADIMIHEISSVVQGQADDMRKAADSIDKENDKVARIYADWTGQPVEKMRDMMRAESWISAWDALELGFVHEVVTMDGKKHKKGAMTNNLDRAQMLMMSFQQKQITQQMTAEEKKQLDDALAAKNAAEQQLASLTAEVAELKSKNQAAEEAALSMRAESLVDGAVASGKIGAEMKANFVMLAKGNYEGTKTVLDQMATSRPSLQEFVMSGQGSKESGKEDRKDWDLAKWSMEDEAGLRQMRFENPAAYEALKNNLK